MWWPQAMHSCRHFTWEGEEAFPVWTSKEHKEEHRCKRQRNSFVHNFMPASFEYVYPHLFPSLWLPYFTDGMHVAIFVWKHMKYILTVYKVEWEASFSWEVKKTHSSICNLTSFSWLSQQLDWQGCILLRVLTLKNISHVHQHMSKCLNSWCSLKWHDAPKSLHYSIRRWRFSLKKRFLKSVQFIPKASGIRTQSDCSRDILMKLPGWAVYQRLMETSGGRMSSNSWTAVQQRGLSCRIPNILP